MSLSIEQCYEDLLKCARQGDAQVAKNLLASLNQLRVQRGDTFGSGLPLQGLKEDDPMYGEADLDGSVLLHTAIRRDDPVLTQMFVDAGAELGESEHGQLPTPLHYAAYRGVLEIVTILLGAGASVSDGLYDTDIDYSGRTPLRLAVEMGHDLVVRALVEAGSDPTGSGAIMDDTPLLMIALSHGDQPTAIELLKSYKGSRGQELGALFQAAINENPEAIRAAAILHQVPEDLQEDMSLVLRCVAGWAAPGVVTALIEEGACIEVDEYSSDMAPLLVAVCHGNLAVVQVLVEEGANVNSAFGNYGGDEGGWTALDFARSRGDRELISYLEKAGGQIGEPQETSSGSGAPERQYTDDLPG